MNRPVESSFPAGRLTTLSTTWRRWYWRALPAYWLFLFLITHLPKLELRSAPPSSDKVLHFTAFGILTFLLWRFLEAQGMRATPRFIAGCGVILVGYAAVDEYLQQFVGRGTDLADWIADVAGIAAVLSAMSILAALRKRRAVRNACHPQTKRSA